MATVPLPIKYVYTPEELYSLLYPTTTSSFSFSSSTSSSSKRKKFIHYKGFGSTIITPSSDTMIQELQTADIIQFDGDNYELTSFMKVIPVVLGIPFLHHNVLDPSTTDTLKYQIDSVSSSFSSTVSSPSVSIDKRIPQLLSFKLESEMNLYFKKSWGNVRIPSDYANHIILWCYVVKDEIINIHTNPLLSYKPYYEQLPLHPNNEESIPDDNLSSEQEKYVGLGAYAIQLCYTLMLIHNHDGGYNSSNSLQNNTTTNTTEKEEHKQDDIQYERKVVCWGGYHVILREFAMNKIRSCSESYQRLQDYYVGKKSMSSTTSSLSTESTIRIPYEYTTLAHAIPSSSLVSLLKDQHDGITVLINRLDTLESIPMMVWDYYPATRIRRVEKVKKVKEKNTTMDDTPAVVVAEQYEEQEGLLLQLQKYNYKCLVIKNDI